MTSGLSRLTRPATATPRWRPASSSTRRQPRSPSRASRDDVAQPQRPVRGRRGRPRRACGADEGLEAAAVAAPADRAVLVDRQVADLAGRARAAPEQLAAEDEAGTHAVGDLDVDPVLNPLQRTASSARRARRGWRCCPATTGAREPALHLLGRRPPHATRAGCPRSPTWPDTLSTGAGSPTPTALMSGIVLPAFSTRSSDQPRGPLHALVGVVVGGQRHPLPADDVAWAGADRDPHVPVTERDAGQQGVAGRERDEHGPPAVADARCELDGSRRRRAP